jgi:predicted transcriptional regulator
LIKESEAQLTGEEIMPTLPRARDIMSRNPLTIQADMVVREAATLLKKKKAFTAPVLDENNNFIGVFSIQGCIEAFIDVVYHEVPIPIHVRDYLEPSSSSITENTGLFEIAEIFVHRDERLVISLPVLRDGRVIGLVYRQDVLDAIIDLAAKFPRPEASVLYLSSLRDRSEVPKKLW